MSHDRWGAKVTDPGALRVLAHTERYEMLEHLQIEGPATATECAALTGLSPSACSYHLRLLAKYGFVEAGEPRGDGRERVWRAASSGWRSDVDDIEAEPAEARAADAAVWRQLMDVERRRAAAWVQHAHAAEPGWRRASLTSNSTLRLTIEELEDLEERLLDLVKTFNAINRHAEDAPGDARVVDCFLRLFPRPPPTPHEAAED